MYLQSRLLVLFLLSLVIHGCGGSYIVKQDETISKAEASGYAIVSYTRSGERDIPFRLWFTGVEGKTRSVSERINFIADYDFVSESTEISIPKNDFEGRLVVLKLPVGKYKFNRVTIENDHIDEEWDANKVINEPFEIFPNEVIYVGNAHIYSYWDKEKEGRLWMNYRYSDKKERDLDLFFKLYPKLGQIDPKISIQLKNK